MKKLLFFFFVFVSLSSSASHNMGGDITYEYIGSSSNPYRYKITVETYTKWLGSSSADRCEIMIYLGGDSITAPRVNGPSANCPATADGVLIGGCMSNTKYNVYTTEYNFSSPGSYIISTDDPTRNAGICNIFNPSTTSFHLEAELIISPFLGNNSGPVYSEVPVICPMIGIPYYYNPLATDVNGDSLYYELITPMEYGSPVFSYTPPSTSSLFAIDRDTVTWDSPNMLCTYIFDIRISEYRNIAGNYYLIGKTMQEVYATTTPFIGVAENNKPNTSVNIFPNPGNGLINYTIENPLQNQKYQMEIINSVGQLIKTIDIADNSGILNESELSAGIYFYSLKNNTEILNKGKFVVLGGYMK